MLKRRYSMLIAVAAPTPGRAGHRALGGRRSLQCRRMPASSAVTMQKLGNTEPEDRS